MLVFWASIATVAYALVVFPALVLLRARLVRRPIRGDSAPEQRAGVEGLDTPFVSVVATVHDEAAVIGAKLDNLAGLDYPAGALEVVVASDGSSDATNAIVSARADDRVKLVALPRVGKAEAIDRGVKASRGEILVFTDANSMFSPGALREIVALFRDPSVGGVAGNQRYAPDEHGHRAGASSGERSYWSLDTALKEAESASGSVVSATGAIYAVRRELYGRPPDGVTDDFAISTGVVDAGARLVFAREAVAFEAPADSHRAEYARKVRVMTRGLRAVIYRRRLLDPRRTGFYAVQLATHKVLRRLLVIPFFAIAASTPFLVDRGAVYVVAAGMQAVVYLLGFAGLALAGTGLGRVPALAIPAYFCMVNAAAAHAVWNVVRGTRIERWEPVRAPASGP